MEDKRLKHVDLGKAIEASENGEGVIGNVLLLLNLLLLVCKCKFGVIY